MRAARLHTARQVRIADIPRPQPGPGEVLVRVRAVSVCHSDVLIWQLGRASGGEALTQPLVQGHEFSGEVVALGEGTPGPAPGSRVAVEPSWPCGQCDLCARDLPHLCRNIVFPSYPPRDGALAECVTCPVTSLFPLPKEITYVEGALLEPLGVGVHALCLAGGLAGRRVAVLGAGMVGASVVALARLQDPAELAVVEPVAGRREITAALGATRTAAGAAELVTEGREYDLIVECAGAPESFQEALTLTAPAGRAVIIGIPNEDRVCFDSPTARRKELTVIFSRRSRHAVPECLELAVRGQVDLSAFPVRKYALEQTAEAMEATAACPGDMLRAIVEP